MAKKKAEGKRHRILFIRHSLTRISRNYFFVLIILLILWWVAPYAPGFFRPPNDIYLLWGSIVLAIGMLLALFFRSRAFVQARKRHVLIKIPLFRLRIPYERIENVRMVMFRDLYEKKKLGWAQKRFLSYYFPKTVVTINLNRFPISEGLARLFLPGYLFIPRDKGRGLVIHTKYYLDFSTEVDSALNVSRAQGGASKDPATKDEMAFDGYFDLDG